MTIETAIPPATPPVANLSRPCDPAAIDAVGYRSSIEVSRSRYRESHSPTGWSFDYAFSSPTGLVAGFIPIASAVDAFRQLTNMFGDVIAEHLIFIASENVPAGLVEENVNSYKFLNKYFNIKNGVLTVYGAFAKRL